MNFDLAMQALLVALVAALVAGLPPAFLVTADMNSAARAYQFRQILTIAFVGSFVIGLPLALTVFSKIADNPNVDFIQLIGIANLVATVLMVLLFFMGGLFAVVAFGVPVFLAANAFAILGWFAVVRPYRA